MTWAWWGMCVSSFVLCFQFHCFMDIVMACGGRTMHLSKLQKLGAKQLLHETQVEAIALTEKVILFLRKGWTITYRGLAYGIKWWKSTEENSPWSILAQIIFGAAGASREVHWDQSARVWLNPVEVCVDMQQPHISQELYFRPWDSKLRGYSVHTSHVFEFIFLLGILELNQWQSLKIFRSQMHCSLICGSSWARNEICSTFVVPWLQH